MARAASMITVALQFASSPFCPVGQGCRCDVRTTYSSGFSRPRISASAFAASLARIRASGSGGGGAIWAATPLATKSSVHKISALRSLTWVIGQLVIFGKRRLYLEQLGSVVRATWLEWHRHSCLCVL